MRALVNVACGSWYGAGQRRLRQSLVGIGDTTERIFLRRFPGKSHSEVPYGFKVDAFREAQRRGYEQVIWMDSSCWVVRPLETAWKQIERDGYLLGQEGWSLGQWCRQEVLDEAGLTRKQALEIPLVEGKMIGLDLTTDVGREFLGRWEQAKDRGWFNGSHVNHRHDISAGAIAAHQMGLELTPHLIEFNSRKPPHPEVFLRAEGM